jgi:hypothetical protein
METGRQLGPEITPEATADGHVAREGARGTKREERKMSKSKKTTRTSKLTKKAKPRKGAGVAERIADQAIAVTEEHLAETPAAKRDDLCVFAFRLTAEERNAIHKAAGPAKASKFARTLLVAAARNDEAAVKAILKGIQTEA